MDEYLIEFKKLSEQEHPELLPLAIQKMDTELNILAKQVTPVQESQPRAKASRAGVVGRFVTGVAIEGAILYSVFVRNVEISAPNLVALGVGGYIASRLMFGSIEDESADPDVAKNTTDEFNQLVALRQEAYDRGVELGIFPKPEIVEGTDQQFAFHQDLVTQADSMDLNLRTE